MIYVGLDVHSTWTTVAGSDTGSGEVIRIDRMPNEREAIRRTLGGLQGPRGVAEALARRALHGVMEAGTNAWAMYRELLPLFEELVVADPATLWQRRTDRGAKTDRRDALRMAERLYRGEIEPIYIPDERTQDLRALVRGKIRASRWVTRLTNEIGSLLRSWGYVGQRSLLSKSGRERLEEAKLPTHSARVLQLWRELLEKAEDIENELQTTIEQEAEKERDCAILQTMPGVGTFTALLLRAEIGDIRRFAKPSKLVSYIGWAPRVFQSGDRCYYGGLGQWGNRWLKYGHRTPGSTGCPRPKGHSSASLVLADMFAGSPQQCEGGCGQEGSGDHPPFAHQEGIVEYQGTGGQRTRSCCCLPAPSLEPERVQFCVLHPEVQAD